MATAINVETFGGFHRGRTDLDRLRANRYGQLELLVPTLARDLHFASAADAETDWNVANPTHPTIYVHSETTPATDYMDFYHDATSGYINVASGTLLLQIDATTVVTVAAASVTHSQDVIISSGFGLNVGSATQVTISDGDGATNLIPEGQFLGVGTAFAGGALVLATFNTTNDRTVSPKLAFLKGAAATQVATTGVADNEVVGSIIAYGSDTGDFETPIAAIEFVVDDVGVPGASAIGGSLEFYTTADGGSTLTLSFTINNDQNIYVANNNGIVIGHTAQITAGSVAELQVLGTALADASVIIGVAVASAVGPELQFSKSRAGTIGTVAASIVSDNDEVGRIVWLPADSVDFATEAAVFQAEVDDASPAAGDIGMAFVWESMAGGGAAIAERMRLTATGDLLIANGGGVVIGHTAQVAVLAATPEFQVLGTAAADSGLLLLRSSGDATGPILYFAKARDAIGTFTTAITTGDVLGGIEAIGADTADLNANANAAAAIRFVSSGTIAADRIPGEIRFLTATDIPGSVLTLAMTISNAQLATFAGNVTMSAGASRTLTVETTLAAGNSLLTLALPAAGTGLARVHFLQGSGNGDADNMGYRFEYEGGINRFALVSADIDGASTEGLLFSVLDGANDVAFAGGLSVDGAAAPTSGITLGLAGGATGTLRLTGTTSGVVTVNVSAAADTFTLNLTEGVRSIDVQLTNAQVLALRAAPLTLIAAPGANRAIIVHKVYLVSDSAAGAWTEPDVNNLVLEYGNGTDITGAIEATGFVTTGSVQVRTYGVTDTEVTPAANSVVRLFQVGAAEFGGGNAANTLSVRVWYSVVDTVAFT